MITSVRQDCYEGEGRTLEGVVRTDCQEGGRNALHVGSVWAPGCCRGCGEGALSSWRGGEFLWVK